MGRKFDPGIYKITSPSGKMYVGQTRYLEDRKRQYRRGQGHKQLKLTNSINKYGFDAHVFEVLERCAVEELNAKEKYYVDLFQTFNTPHGLNSRDGGGARVHCAEETKKKLSEGRMGAKHHLYGKKLSEEHRRKISIANKGRVFPKRKIVVKKPPQDKRTMLGKTGALCPNSIPLDQYDLCGVYLKSWPCAMEASRELKISSRNICSVCNGRRSSAGGFVWMFKHKPISINIRPHSEWKRKPVLQFDLNGSLVANWESVTQAHNTLGINSVTLLNRLNGNCNPFKGYIWKYKNDDK